MEILRKYQKVSARGQEIFEDLDGKVSNIFYFFKKFEK